MNYSSKGPRYLMRWDHTREQRLGRDVLGTTHRLAELPLFSDEGLSQLIDRYPREALQVSTTGDDPAYPSQSRFGRIKHHSGVELLEMIRRGRLCLRLKHLAENHAALRKIVQRLCREMMECQPGLRTCDHDGDLEISSPTALTYYRFDVKPTVFWQIRGCPVMLAYPQGEPFVHSQSLEETIVSATPKPLYFEPAFDDQANRFSLASGEALSLPQHTPYRITNDQRLSVTLTTNYLTRESRRRNEIHRANHVLNRYLPTARRSRSTVGVRASVKRALLRVATTRGDAPQDSPSPSFCVDPNAPRCVGPLNSTTQPSKTISPTFPGLSFQASVSATATSKS